MSVATFPFVLIGCDGDGESPSRLVSELQFREQECGEKFTRLGADLFEIHKATAEPRFFFSQQALIAPQVIHANSISTFAEGIFEKLVQYESVLADGFLLHIFPLPAPQAPGSRRCELIHEALVAKLKRQRRSLFRALLPLPDHETQNSLVQVGFLSTDEGLISILPGEERAQFPKEFVSSFPLGRLEIADDPHPPARAFKKLLETEIRWGRSIQKGETCVDLGASPGSWSYVAQARGATVIAVDRSELRADLMHHPQVKFVSGDAFRYQPDAPVDWMLCDIAAYPERTTELLQQWIERRWCRSFIVTLKFRGMPEIAPLEELRRWLTERVDEFTMRHLNANKNELVVYGQTKR